MRDARGKGPDTRNEERGLDIVVVGAGPWGERYCRTVVEILAGNGCASALSRKRLGVASRTAGEVASQRHSLTEAELSLELLRVRHRPLAGVVHADVGGGLAVARRTFGEEGHEPSSILVAFGAARDHLVRQVV